MRNYTVAISIASLTFFLVAVLAVSVFARPAKDTFEGKTTGNTGFTNIVDDNFGDNDVSGWVRYSKAGKVLHTTWTVNGLQPNTDYQLKLNSKDGDLRVRNACDAPNTGAIWQCGDWGGTDSFLVMATVQSNAEGRIGAGVAEDRLESGDYSNVQFIVTENFSPWSSAWTWENPLGTVSTFTIK
jgi:hypothetical protein